MQKTVYYSKKYLAQQAADGAPVAAGAKVAVRRTSRTVPLILAVCIALAVLLVLVVPMAVDGAPAPASRAMKAASAAPQKVEQYDSVQKAMAFLGIDAALPQVLPEGFVLTGCAVVDDTILELTYTGERTSFVFRTAAGKDDLSGESLENHHYAATETVDGVTRSYAGTSAEQLSLAVWAFDGHTYAVVATGGLDAAAMRGLAESIR